MRISGIDEELDEGWNEEQPIRFYEHESGDVIVEFRGEGGRRFTSYEAAYSWLGQACDARANGSRLLPPTWAIG